MWEKHILPWFRVIFSLLGKVLIKNSLFFKLPFEFELIKSSSSLSGNAFKGATVCIILGDAEFWSMSAASSHGKRLLPDERCLNEPDDIGMLLSLPRPAIMRLEPLMLMLLLFRSDFCERAELAEADADDEDADTIHSMSGSYPPDKATPDWGILTP